MPKRKFEEDFIKAITGENNDATLERSNAVITGIAGAVLTALLLAAIILIPVFTTVSAGFLTFSFSLMFLSPLLGGAFYITGFLTKFTYRYARLMERIGLIILLLTVVSFLSLLWVKVA